VSAEKILASRAASARRVSQVSDAELIELAASRYGRRNPSFDGVLATRWPLYHVDAIHTAGYHRMSRLAFEMVLERGLKRACVVCGTELAGHRSKKYCSDPCRTKAHHATVARPRGRYRPITDEDRELICSMYRSGLTVLQISVELDRSTAGVSSVLHAAGVSMRRSGPRAKATRERRAA
jgi:hypothetical protein